MTGRWVYVCLVKKAIVIGHREPLSAERGCEFEFKPLVTMIEVGTLNFGFAWMIEVEFSMVILDFFKESYKIQLN